MICFRGDKLYNEHIYWDQASVLVQIGLLDEKLYPVDWTRIAGAKTTRPEHWPSNDAEPALVQQRCRRIWQRNSAGLDPRPHRGRASRLVVSGCISLGSSVGGRDRRRKPRPDAVVFDLQHGLWDRLTLEAVAIGLVRHRVFAAGAGSRATDALEIGSSAGRRCRRRHRAAGRDGGAGAQRPSRRHGSRPHGARSGGGIRPLQRFTPVCRRGAREHTFVAVMIETSRWVSPTRPRLRRRPGLDMVFIGTGDLVDLAWTASPAAAPPLESRDRGTIKAGCCRAAGNGVRHLHAICQHGPRAAPPGFCNSPCSATTRLLIGGALRTAVFRLRQRRSRRGFDLGSARPPSSPGPPAASAAPSCSACSPQAVPKIYCAARDPAHIQDLIADQRRTDSAPDQRSTSPTIAAVTAAAGGGFRTRRC